MGGLEAATHDTPLPYDASIAYALSLPAFSLASLSLEVLEAQEWFRSTQSRQRQTDLTATILHRRIAGLVLDRRRAAQQPWWRVMQRRWRTMSARQEIASTAGDLQTRWIGDPAPRITSAMCWRMVSVVVGME